jgi:peptidoglycan/LPS O-acetylase OafA/YrhL
MIFTLGMKKIEGFDGLRAICAFMVLYGHSEFSITHIPEEGFWLDIYAAGLNGSAGVMVFFVLSGYLISQLLVKELSETGSIKYGYFIMRRVLRLLPAYLAFLIVLSVLVITGFLEIKAIALVSAFSYTYNFLPRTFGSGYTNHLWSLAVEEQFYLLFPLLMKKAAPRNFQMAILLIIVAGIVMINLIVQLPLPDYEFVYRGQLENLREVGFERIFKVEMLFLPAGLYCLMGCLFGLSQELLAARLLRGRVEAGLVLVFATVLYFNAALVNIPFYGGNQLVQCTGVGFALLFIHHRQQGWLTKTLCIGPLPYLGKISYGTYVWHGLFITSGPGSCIYWWQGVSFGFIFTYIASVFSFEVIEKPFLQLKDRFRQYLPNDHNS